MQALALAWFTASWSSDECNPEWNIRYVSYLYKHHTVVLEIFQKIWALTDSRGLSCYQAWWHVLFCSLVRFGLLWHPIWPKQKQHTLSACRWSDKRLNLHTWLTGEKSVEEDGTDLGGIGCIIKIIMLRGEKYGNADCWCAVEKFFLNIWLRENGKMHSARLFPKTACLISRTWHCANIM